MLAHKYGLTFRLETPEKYPLSAQIVDKLAVSPLRLY